MPEANVLYIVSAAVVLALVVWVAAVLKMAKEPWARPTPHVAADGAEVVAVAEAKAPPIAAAQPEEKTEEKAAEKAAEKTDEKAD